MITVFQSQLLPGRVRPGGGGPVPVLAGGRGSGETSKTSFLKLQFRIEMFYTNTNYFMYSKIMNTCISKIFLGCKKKIYQILHEWLQTLTDRLQGLLELPFTTKSEYFIKFLEYISG